jgi:hypothetical protein
MHLLGKGFQTGSLDSGAGLLFSRELWNASRPFFIQHLLGERFQRQAALLRLPGDLHALQESSWKTCL